MLEPARISYSFDGFLLDVRRRLLLRQGQAVPISPKGFEVLLALVENHQRELTKDELMERVWRDQIVEDANLTVTISQIRKALGERANENRFIVTIPGRGYRFVGDLQDEGDIVVAHHTVSEIVIEEEEQPSGDRSLASFDSAPAMTPAPAPAPERSVAAISRDAAIETRPPRRSMAAWVVSAGLLLALFASFGLWFSYSRKEPRVNIPARPFSQTSSRQLTTNGNISWAIISPDGKFYVYVLAERGDSKYSLWLGQINSGSDLQLRPAEEIFYNGIAFSSDSKNIYYCTSSQRDSPSTLYRMPVLGGVPEKLLSRVGWFYSLSPDDRQIAFFRAGEESRALVIINLDGSGERVVATAPAGKAFASNAPAWAPDGSKLAVALSTGDRREEIFIVQVAQGSLRQLTTVNWSNVISLAWLPNGQGIISVASPGGAVFSQLWQIDQDTGEARRISRDIDNYGSPLSLSSDSNLLLAVQERAESNIWVGSANDPGQARQVTFGSIGAVYGWNGMDWASDGRLIFSGARDEGRVIYAAKADGSKLSQLTPAGFVDEKVSVTADGRFIVFQSNRSGDIEIWRAQSDGTDLRQLTTGGRNALPHVTPDGAWVLYSSMRENKSEVWRLPIGGGEPIRVTDRECSNPRVSPDGKNFACIYRTENDLRWQIAVFAIAGGPPLKLFEAPPTAAFNDGIRWMPAGKAFCYRDWGGGLWKQELTGGAPQLVPGLRDSQIRAYAWSPDGKQFAFSKAAAIRDAVLIRNQQ